MFSGVPADMCEKKWGQHLVLISFQFSFFVLVNEFTKIRKYYIIFCLSCKARGARKNKQTELKWPKYEKTKMPKWNEPNINHQDKNMIDKDQNVYYLSNIIVSTYNTVSTHHLFVTKTKYDEKLQISGPQQHKQEQQLKKTLPSHFLVLCITI